MKRFVALFLAVFTLCAAAAAEGFTYSVTSVTDCAQTQRMYDAFYQSGELSVPVPGLAEGLVPQGLAYLAEENWMLYAGYSSDDRNSALLAVDMETGELVKEVILQYQDGSDYRGHAGGVCVTERDIYISNAHKLYRISLDTFRALSPSGVCRFEEEIPVPVNSSYCCYADGVLWVGEFQYGNDYKTDKSHKVKTADGRQQAWTCGYVLSAENDGRIRPDARPAEGDATPDYILSMTERIQGITVKDGMIYLSQSYGRKNSSLLFRYQNVLAGEPALQTELNGVSVPVWILDSTVLDTALIAPPMSECLCTIGGDVYVLFESAASVYMAGGSLNPMDRVFRLTDF